MRLPNDQRDAPRPLEGGVAHLRRGADEAGVGPADGAGLAVANDAELRAEVESLLQSGTTRR